MGHNFSVVGSRTACDIISPLTSVRSSAFGTQRSAINLPAALVAVLWRGIAGTPTEEAKAKIVEMVLFGGTASFGGRFALDRSSGHSQLAGMNLLSTKVRAKGEEGAFVETAAPWALELEGSARLPRAAAAAARLGAWGCPLPLPSGVLLLGIRLANLRDRECS